MHRWVSRRTLLRGAFGLAATFGLTQILTACGGETPTPTSAPAKTGDESKPTAAAKTAAPASGTPATAGNVEIVYLNQSRGQFKAMSTLAEKYTKEFGVKVTIDSPGPTDYPKKLQAASQAGNMPDTYYAIGAADMAPYYKAGFALNLKPELENGWKKNFQPIMLELSEFREGNSLGVPPGIYSVPWEAISYGVLYNPALYEKAKLDPKKTPATTPEFLDALKAITGAGSGGFAVADNHIYQFLQTYASNWLSDEEIDATHAGKAPWQSDGWKNVLQIFADMRDANVIFNNTLNATNPDLEKSFFNVQELSTFFTGVYSIPVQVTTAPDFTAYSAYKVPKAADAKFDVRSHGGPGKNGVVNPKGKHVDEALKYVKWLTEKDQALVFMEVVPLVSTNPEALDPQKISPQLAVFAAQLENLQKVPTPRIGPVNEALMKGVQSLLLQEKTVDQVLEDADTAQKG